MNVGEIARALKVVVNASLLVMEGERARNFIQNGQQIASHFDNKFTLCVIAYL